MDKLLCIITACLIGVGGFLSSYSHLESDEKTGNLAYSKGQLQDQLVHVSFMPSCCGEYNNDEKHQFFDQYAKFSSHAKRYFIRYIFDHRPVSQGFTYEEIYKIGCVFII